MFKLQMSHTQDIKVYEVVRRDLPSTVALIICVDTPPLFFCKRPEGQSHVSGATRWSTREAWWRQTEISSDPTKNRGLPTSLKNETSQINIGRWTTYRVLFDLEKCGNEYRRLCNALHEFNIQVQLCPHFIMTDKDIRPVWHYIDRVQSSSTQKSQSSLAQLLGDGVISLPFEVRYQLEVCISEGWLSEYSMSRTFVGELQKLDTRTAVDLLEHVASQKKRHFDPMEIFQLSATWQPRRKIPSYCIFLRTAVITPATIYFSSPTLETSNRVLRRFREDADRFLRVRFQEEKPHGKIYGSQEEQKNEIFSRVKQTLANGINVGDRHYEFLAFGNSQFRENGAFFFASDNHLSATKIRRWMGDFDDDVIARYAARLGQCFSTTRAIHGVKASIVEIVDITTPNDAYMFTDGVGMISPTLAVMAANETGSLLPNGEAPSVMQFRLGGAKGVLARWPQAKMWEIHIRKSQSKFAAKYEGLEVIRWSAFASAHLNRQLIAVLTARDVPDDIFIKKLDNQIESLSRAMTDEHIALNMLQKEVDANQMTLTIARMILDGFQASREPFLTSLLHLWRAYSIKYLKEKAKIAIHQGAILLGCVDEIGELKHGYFRDQQPRKGEPNNPEALPEIFVQPYNAKEGRFEVKTGLMCVARNPSLYAGDVQVVRGVDRRALHHLKDVVVFPRVGDRDLPSMLSGGDLDGDDFVVIWDQDIIPRNWHEEASNFPAATAQKVDHEPTVDEITSFFVQFMQNDSLGRIAIAHLATADRYRDGVRDPRCTALAELHSRAVDYNKSGQPAVMPPNLRPRERPHFLGSKTGKTYKSITVLGKLYDRVELVDFTPDYESSFSEKILAAYTLDEDLLHAAKDIKARYDEAIRRIMSQHDIETDCEVWSTFVMKHASTSGDFKFHETIGNAAGALKETFREECYAQAGGRDYDEIAPFAAAMYKVTQMEVAKALEETKQMVFMDGSERPVRIKSKQTMPLMSFPWLFPTVLGRIASGALGGTAISSLPAIVPSELQAKAPKRMVSPTNPTKSPSEDLLTTEHGETHFGDILKLFKQVDQCESEQSSDLSLAKSNLQAGQATDSNGAASPSSRPEPSPSGKLCRSPAGSATPLDSEDSSPSNSQPVHVSQTMSKDVATDGPLRPGTETPNGNVKAEGDDEWSNEDSDDEGEEIILPPTTPKLNPFEQLARLIQKESSDGE